MSAVTKTPDSEGHRLADYTNSPPGSKLPLRFAMKVRLRIKNAGTLYEAVHEITDAGTFGRAFADVWIHMHNRRLQKATSIGALMEVLNEDVIEELNGASIVFEKL